MLEIEDELAIRDLNARYIDAVKAQLDFVVMALNSGTLSREGDVVRGPWYVTEHLRSRDGSGRRVLGTHQDEYVRAGGEWRFARRSYHVIHQGACDLSGELRPIPD